MARDWNSQATNVAKNELLLLPESKHYEQVVTWFKSSLEKIILKF